MHFARPTVLFVDDEPAIAELYRSGLEDNAFDVRVCGSGHALFVELEVRTPDAVVLDWNLPDMPGVEILDRMRGNDRTRRLAVLVMSNIPATPELSGAAARDGVIDWLLKVETTPALLAERLRDALDGGGFAEAG